MATLEESFSSEQLSMSLNQDHALEELYVPVKVLGRGAFGEAKLYRKTEDNSLVVWKEISLCKLSERARQHTQNEIDILAMLNHPNIIGYYNHFVTEDMLYIEMEYANGGSLSEKIKASEAPFPEEEVIWYFYQLVIAVAYIHSYGILHRDIKTLNLFLTKSGLIKVGDFGLSKVLESKNEMADSVVGTPYYMSPELCRGEQYNQKSDIWAVGCILYELMTRTKTFNASNALKLVAIIIKGEYKEVDDKYSENLRAILNQLLSQDPLDRPSAEEILNRSPLNDRKMVLAQKVADLSCFAQKARMTTTETIPVVTSTWSEVYWWGAGKLLPQKIDTFKDTSVAVQVSAGYSHFAVITVEKELYTWTNAGGISALSGELGHGDLAWYRLPKKVIALDGILVKQVACGQQFTLCLSEEGYVYTWGSDYHGCLGCDQAFGEEVTLPMKVEFFNERPVKQISCGLNHVICLTQDEEVYTWGCGEYGCLGLGNEDTYYSPQKVNLRDQVINLVHAGLDGSFFITSGGKVFACGNNEFNKVALDQIIPGLKDNQVAFRLLPSPVRALNKYHIMMVAGGKNHTAVVDLYGHLITFGSNKYGQLGLGHFRRRPGINLVGGIMAGRIVQKVSCGEDFTVAATADNQVYSWGKAENGCLGLDLMNMAHVSRIDDIPCTSLPRPTFGALHIVSDVSCRNWNVIIIAEQVLNQTIIRPHSSGATRPNSVLNYDTGSTSLSGSEFVPDISENQDVKSKKNTLPDWLRAELDDGEYIPASRVDSEVIHDLQESSGVSSAVHMYEEWFKSYSKNKKSNDQEWQVIGGFVQDMKSEINQLRQQNEKLALLVSTQEETIQRLQLLLKESNISNDSFI